MSTVSSQNSLSYLGVTAPNPPTVVQTTRNPTIPGVRGIDANYPIGTLWVNTSANTAFILTSIVALTPTWDEIGVGATVVASVVGTANQITASPIVAGVITLSTPVAFIAPGSIDSTTTLTGGTGITATTGNIVASTGNITSTLGSMSAATTVTAGTGITATTGNIVASTGNITSTLGSVAAATTVTAGTGITATTGNIVASTGNITSTLGSVAAATTVTAGTGITATTGNIVASTGNITSTLGSVGAATTITAGTSITATLGAITATNGNLVLGTAGNKILSTSVGTTTAAGANSFGSVTLVGGTATVATTSITASSLIVTWRQSIGATGAAPVGLIYTSNIVAGTSFEIHAGTTASVTTDVATDVSVVGWMIIN